MLPTMIRSFLPLSVLLGLTAASTLNAASPASAADQGRRVDTIPSVLSHRAQADAFNDLLRERLDELLPDLMREADVDLWLVVCREYAEDPVYRTLVPQPSFAARRTTMLLFHDRGPEEGVERLTVSRYPIAGFYEAAWEGGDLDAQWDRLAEVLVERDPRRIAIDTSLDWPAADGLTASLHGRLLDALPPELGDRLVSAEELVVRWLETRTENEIEVWVRAVQLARSAIAGAFSSRTVTPGVTTTGDVGWFLRERFEELGLRPWFQPYVNVQRPGGVEDPDAPFFGASDSVIHRGDVLHTDVGICYLGVCTDTQEMGYVLRVGEASVPEGLRDALAVGNRWQDLLTGSFETGRTGNEILAAALAAAEAEGIRSSVYTHPLGAHGHGVGPTIGMWDNQGPTPVRGDWALHPSTGYAIEGNVKVPVPEWDGQSVQIKLEQSAVWDGERVIYLAGRQTEWHVVE